MSLNKIQIDRLAVDGDGVGRLQGQAVFIPYTLPNEEVVARTIEQKKNYSRWLPFEIRKSSPDRVKPRCPLHFSPGQKGPWCGGCNWQHMNVGAQRASKFELLKEALVRMGGVPNPPMHPTISAPDEWRYRNKVQVPFARKGNRTIAGFFAPGSHDIVDFDDCLIQPEESVRLVQLVKRLANEWNWHVYDEDRHQGWLRHLLIRTNDKMEAFVTLVTANPSFRDRDRFVRVMREDKAVIGVYQNIQSARTHAILGREWIKLGGADRIEESILGLRVAASAGAFFQVNKKAAEILYAQAIEWLEPTKESTVLDLYCGVGAMTLLAAQKAKRASGVESVPSAIQDAGVNAQLNRVTNVEFYARDVESFLKRAPQIQNQLVLLDPPRAGCSPEVIHALRNLKAKRIVYVSCHPATLARDVKMLSDFYRVTAVRPVDLFPQTSHIEAVCRLDLK